MNWKGCGRKRLWPNLTYYIGMFMEGLRKTTNNLSPDSRSPGRDLNLGPCKYEAELLTAQPRSLVIFFHYTPLLSFLNLPESFKCQRSSCIESCALLGSLQAFQNAVLSHTPHSDRRPCVADIININSFLVTLPSKWLYRGLWTHSTDLHKVK
jgi:hypothetical protein